jgi:3-oxoadipate enol-lactonase
MPVVPVGSHSVYYEEYGAGHPLVLIAGLSHSRLVWWKQIEQLSSRYRVITPDNRDAGDSAPGKGLYSIADMASDMKGLIQHLDLGPVYLMGWSMGGFISQEISLRYPGTVEKLVLVATSAGGHTHTPPTSEIAAAILPREHENIEALLRRINPILAGPGYMDSHPEDLKQMISQGLAKPMSSKSFQRQYAAIASWKGASDRLDQITIPTLVVHGVTDPLVPYPNGRYLAEHIKGAKFLTYPNVGHLLPVEATARFNRDVMEFLDN